jgi:hypothetical protein
VVEKQAPAPLTVDLMAALQASINAAKAREPHLVRKRDDKRASDCWLSQLTEE